MMMVSTKQECGMCSDRIFCMAVEPGPSRRPSTKDSKYGGGFPEELEFDIWFDTGGKAKEVQKEPGKKVVKVGPPMKGQKKRKNEEIESTDDEEADRGGKKKGRTGK